MLLTRKEVARMLRLSEGFLRHMGAKIMPTVKLGSAVRYRLSDVLTYIESKTIPVVAGETSKGTTQGEIKNKGARNGALNCVS
jgi:hypothetical protein